MEKITGFSHNMSHNFIRGRDKTMEVKKVKNEYGLTVWHVRDEGCIQEFWTLKEALDYVDYVKNLEE